jgi:hypothetical protein
MASAADAVRDAFAVDFATLAREIAQDIFPVEQVVALHRLSDAEWGEIQRHPKFISILADMQREWNSAASTRERVKIKAQTGLESQLEIFINEIGDARIPLTQRVEAGKFLARLGELDGATKAGGQFGDRVQINIFTSEGPQAKPTVTIDAQPTASAQLPGP